MSHSRQPSYYNSYPIATPSSISHDNSPPMLATNTPPLNTSPMTSSPPLSATGTGGANTPKPILAPISTGTNLHRDGSSSSGEIAPARLSNKSSVDRLRSQAGGDRAPSPSSYLGSGAPSEIGEGSTRPNSPHPSTYGYGPGPGSQSSHSQNPRPYLPTGNRNSMGSISSRYLHVGPAGGAPHQGRPINLSMPRPLAEGGDRSGLDPAWDGGRPAHQRMSSRGFEQGEF